MFCPNCGSNCADANFCPACGHNLQDNSTAQSIEERRKQLQASRKMYCPFCLSTEYVVTKEDTRIVYYRSPIASLLQLITNWVQSERERIYGLECTCLQCGKRWFAKKFLLHERHKRLVLQVLGEHSALNFKGLDDAYIQLSQTGVMISLTDSQGSIVPYEELALVDHREAVSPFYGRLTIRDRAHMKRPFPKTYDAARKDRFTILYDADYLEVYQQINSVLKAIAEENKKEGLF